VVVYDKENKNISTNANSVTDKESKKREARKKRRMEATKLRQSGRNATAASIAPSNPKPSPSTVAAIPSGEAAPGPVAEAMAQCSKSQNQANPSSRLALTEETQQLVQLLLPSAAKTIVTSLGQEIVPSLPEARSPEDIMIKAIGEKGPTAKVAKVTELQDTIVKLKSMLATSGGGSEQLNEMESIISQKLEATEQALTKAQRDVPSQMSELKSVMEAKSTYELGIQTRKDQQARGVAKAKERKEARHKHIKDLRDQVILLEKAMIKLEDENDAAHEARAKANADTDSKVIGLFDKKIASLQAPSPGPAAAGQLAPAYLLAPLQALPPVLPTPEVQAPNTLSELNDFKVRFEEMRLKLEAATGAMIRQFEATYAELTPDMLPAVEPPVGDTFTAYATIYDFLQQWKFGGAAPFDWQSLDAAAGTSHSGIGVVQKLVGNVWAKWYPEAAPGPATVVPRQLALTVEHCLSQFKVAYEASDQDVEIKELATRAAVVARESAKRLRSA